MKESMRICDEVIYEIGVGGGKNRPSANSALPPVLRAIRASNEPMMLWPRLTSLPIIFYP